ncbi:Mu-like prophage DNA circulation protein [Edwardsiella hoshinae]|uniref:Mu-like prophage DNA circulation protein n=1 Tax=Edwardsiella hoshinae TaxID=93378 RepID=A0A376D8J3_9GAMM|nr:DNA circularization N-terminal domain-containing protein [Edwardsiella hoshinae]STC84481.1 Mu-like prophage DNA circulation protein [Edwardsiella hoshinae]
MSWQDTLQDASFKGVRFDVLRESTSHGRDHADHEYPFIDGADVHDLGRKARNIRLTAVFWGEDYDTRLQNFLAVLDKAGAGELIHPVYGSIPKAQLIECQVSHDAEQPDYCTVELVFLESSTGTATQAVVKPAQWGDALFNTLDELQGKATALYDAAMSPVQKTRRLLTKGKAALSTMLNTLTIMRSGVKGVFTDSADYLAFPARYVNDLRAVLELRTLATSTILDKQHRQRTGNSAGVMYGDTLVQFTPQGASTPGEPLLRLTGSKPALNGSQSPIQDPTPILSAWTSDCGVLDQVITLPSALINRNITAAVPIPEAAKLADVTDVATLHTTVAAMRATEILTDILTDEAASILTPEHIEQMTNQVRRYIQAALDLNRDTYREFTAHVSDDPEGRGLLWSGVNEQLKSVALGVQILAEQEISRHPPLIIRTVAQDANLHLLAHAWYGDYRRAAELLRLNPRLTDPNAIKAGDKLNAYSR